MEFPHAEIKTLIYSFEKYNATYFRVPKVASSSLLMSFRRSDEVEKVGKYNQSHFKFAFVRDPFDRLASCFRHVIQKGALQNIQSHPDFYRNMSFSQFIDAVEKIDVKDMDIHFRPQNTFIPEKVDFLGKFENIQEDYLKVCEKIGIKNFVSLLHQNKTNKTIFKDYYTSEIIKKVVKIYKRDFDLFGYERKTL